MTPGGKAPSWILTKWSTTEQTLQQKKGCDAFPTFAGFVEEVTFHADRMNIPHIFRQTAKDQTRNSPGTFSPPGPQPRKRLPGSTNLALKTVGERDASSPTSKHTKSEDNPTDKRPLAVNQLSLFYKTKSHTLNECK